ncbi:type 4a pilus biogenesis protein PilO, partial [Candidatus Desantisbacteria bacterium]|nr:type 4a pilus biogenesis protein PilO [Candidatus Desantisbacteria bacterium]
LFLIILFTLYFFIVNPVEKKYFELNKEYSIKYTKLTIGEKNIVQIDLLRKQLKKLKQDILLFPQKLPSRSEIPNILNNITTLGKEKNVEIFINHSEIKIRDSYAEAPLQIDIQGSYHNLGDFIFSISRLPWRINISNINIDSLADNNYPDRTINAHLNTVIYISNLE